MRRVDREKLIDFIEDVLDSGGRITLDVHDAPRSMYDTYKSDNEEIECSGTKWVVFDLCHDVEITLFPSRY